MSTKKIREAIRLMDEQDVFPVQLRRDVLTEVEAIEKAARDLDNGGLDWTSNDTGPYISAVHFIKAISKQSKEKKT